MGLTLNFASVGYSQFQPCNCVQNVSSCTAMICPNPSLTQFVNIDVCCCCSYYFLYMFTHSPISLTGERRDVTVKRLGDFVGQVNNMLCYFCKLTSFVKIGYFNAIVLVFMGVSCRYSSLTKLRICASRGVKLYVESGTCRLLLILIFCLYWVNFCLCSMRFAGVQSMLCLLNESSFLGIFLAVCCFPWSRLVVSWSECIILYASI